MYYVEKIDLCNIYAGATFRTSRAKGCLLPRSWPDLPRCAVGVQKARHLCRLANPMAARAIVRDPKNPVLRFTKGAGQDAWD
jgi:hypothetical protein